MATRTGSRVDPGIVDFVARGVSTVIRGVTPSTWFGPGQPLPPQGPKDLQVRGFDYPFAVNLNTQPRITESGVTYAQLRALADSYDILRIIIETRKDQAVGLPWTFRLRQEPGESDSTRNKRSTADPRIKALNKMFRYPDGERDWKTWLRAVLEEVFVIDALTLAPKYMLDGSISALEVIDGSTILRLIDENARTPLPPSPAYQQILKGMPAKDLTTRDLIFKPRNYRASRIYGYGPVEQILVTVNMALRRQQTQLGYYTEGNVPEALAQVPDGWTKDDIRQFQQMFNNLGADVTQKSRMRFIPKMEGILFSKDKMLSDEFDEWLARIVCFCFSVSPQPFVAMMNRATAESAMDQALTEGLLPILDYISGVVNLFVEKYLGYDDIEHAFTDEATLDKLQQAQVDRIYVSYGKETIDEQRQRDGQDPIGAGSLVFGSAPVPLKPFLKGGAMADGLPEHVKTPEELDAEKEVAFQRQSELASKQPGGEDEPPPPKDKKPVAKSFY